MTHSSQKGRLMHLHPIPSPTGTTARVMNKIQNDRKLRELELKNEVVKTFAGLKGDKAKAKKSATSVAHGKGSREKK